MKNINDVTEEILEILFFSEKDLDEGFGPKQKNRRIKKDLREKKISQLLEIFKKHDFTYTS